MRDEAASGHGRAHDASLKVEPAREEPRGLRIMVAHDLSASADRAAAMIAAATWPEGTVIRVVSSRMGIGRALSSFAGIREIRAHARDVRDAIAATHDRVASSFAETGRAVETRTLLGRPASAIVADAGRWGADLIVVGARDQGPLESMLLGSVSRSVVERAPCSVLVARGRVVSSVVLAVDGSAPSVSATRLVARWPMFAAARVRVVGVGQLPPRYPGVGASDTEQQAAFAGTVDLETARVHDIVGGAVAELLAQGREAEGEIRTGGAASEIIAAAQAGPADLVVMGAHGESALRRLLLGSVVRTVLEGVRSSVLIARPLPDTGPSSVSAG